MERRGRSAELQNLSAGIAGDDRGHAGLADRAATVNEYGLLAVKAANGANQMMGSEQLCLESQFPKSYLPSFDVWANSPSMAGTSIEDDLMSEEDEERRLRSPLRLLNLL